MTTIFEVAVLEIQHDGKHIWRVLLRTRDEVEARTLYDSLRADPEVRARMLEEPT